MGGCKTAETIDKPEIKELLGKLKTESKAFEILIAAKGSDDDIKSTASTAMNVSEISGCVQS